MELEQQIWSSDIESSIRSRKIKGKGGERQGRGGEGIDPYQPERKTKNNPRTGLRVLVVTLYKDLRHS